MAIVSISVPDDLLRQVDQRIRAGSYSGRSEFVRAALRDLLAVEAARQRHAGPKSATLTLVYPKEDERRIGEIRHHYGDVVKSLVHSDTMSSCTEVFILQGDSARIDEFADKLRAYRHTQLVRLVTTEQPASDATKS